VHDIIDIMAQLIVRNLEAELVRLLKKRAAARGRSAEEEHREILRHALMPKPRLDFKQLLQQMPDVGEDSDFERVDDRGREVTL
jgi:plasmid stability protein